MKILQITSKFPYPLNHGAAWAITGIAKGLIGCGHTIDLCSLVMPGHDSDDMSTLCQSEVGYDHINIIEADTSINKLAATINLFSSKSLHVTRFGQQSIKDRLIAACRQGKYQVIIFESLYLCGVIPQLREVLPSAKLIYRAHNVEFKLWDLYGAQKGGLKRAYFKGQSERIKKWEKEVITKADGVLTVSDVDRDILMQRFGQGEKMITIPIGIPKSDLIPLETEDKPFIIGFLGGLDWRPNRDGVDWFLSHVWQEVYQFNHGNIIFMIAGKCEARDKRTKFPEVQFLGEIDRSDSFLKNIDVLVVPLRSGSGTRVKILEALSLGVSICSTNLGAEGINVKDGEHLMIVEDKASWSAAIKALHEEKNRKRLRTNGHAFVQQEHCIVAIGDKLHHWMEEHE